jgi:hypothetical protein
MIEASAAGFLEFFLLEASDDVDQLDALQLAPGQERRRGVALNDGVARWVA